MEWENLWKHTEQKFGGKVELLVNNAGLNHELLSWRPSLDVMLYGVMLGTFMARDKMAVTKVRMYTRIVGFAQTYHIFKKVLNGFLVRIYFTFREALEDALLTLVLVLDL